MGVNVGLDEERVSAWLAANIAEATEPFTFSLIAGGRSNLTFEVLDGLGERFVLRRPPLGHVLATAHDMGREHRLISAVGTTSVPVPRALGLCTDVDVTGRAVLRDELRRGCGAGRSREGGAPVG